MNDMNNINNVVDKIFGKVIVGESIFIPNNDYDQPINIVEKDNKKYLQYELIGLNSKHIKVEKKFINRTRELFIVVTGEFKDELTGWENDININLKVDWRVYDKVTYDIKDGILTVILHEIINDEPEVDVFSDYGWMNRIG